jgi:hypothetical protein
MTVDTSGKWWTGTDPDDVREFLVAYSEDAYVVDEFGLARCACGSIDFHLWADDDEGAAKRRCARCASEQFVCDSAEYWSDAKPEQWRCIECDGDVTNVGVGFSLYADSRDVRWLYVGVRCTSCGILGCFAGWKVGYVDDTLMARV